jgi:hypothetical protein
MKVKKILTAIIILIMGVLIFSCSGTRKIKADPPLESTDIKNMIDSQSFVFKALYVSPMGGRRRDITPDYELSVSKDTVISYLPYFGRGYTAPISPADVDYDFTSKKFTYKVTPAGRGWNVSIKIQDQPNLREMYLRIFDNASASLTVSGIDRNSISYDGYITRRSPATRKK